MKKNIDNGNPSYSYSTEELMEWIRKGELDKDLADYQLHSLKRAEQLSSASVELTNRCKAEGRDPTPEEWVQMYQCNSTPSSATDLEKIQLFLKFLEERHAASQTILPTLFKGLKPDEFGASRLHTDRMAYLPKLLENPTLHYIKASTYKLAAEEKDSKGNSIRLELWFESPSTNDAHQIYDSLRTRLQGVILKIWQACWKTACDRGRHVFECSMVELMRATYPNRDSDFSSDEKLTFFAHLRILEQTKLHLSYKEKEAKGKRKTELRETLELRLLEIVKCHGGDAAIFPEKITISVMDPSRFEKEKMAFVPAKFKRATLELHADNMKLATYIQMRAAQTQTSPTITMDRSYLIKLAGLEKTDAKHRPMANKCLRNQLERLMEKGIIDSVPSKIGEVVTLRIKR